MRHSELRYGLRITQTGSSRRSVLQKSSKEIPKDTSSEADGNQFRYVQQNRACWRCRQRFPVLIAPYELESVLLFRCDQTGDYRYLPIDDADQIAAQRSTGHTAKSATSRSDSPITQKQFETCLEEFLKTAKCACGGRYYLANKSPVKCPRCGARSFSWWPWPEKVVVSSNIPKLAT